MHYLYYFLIFLLIGCSKNNGHDDPGRLALSATTCHRLIEEVADGIVLISGNYKSELSEEMSIIEKCRGKSEAGEILAADMFIAQAEGDADRVRKIVNLLCDVESEGDLVICFSDYQRKVEAYRLLSSPDGVRIKSKYILSDVGHSLFPDNRHMQKLWISYMAEISQERAINEILSKDLVIDSMTIKSVCKHNNEVEVKACFNRLKSRVPR